MSTLTISVSDSLEAALAERAKMAGARSTEEYLLSLAESDCATGALDQVLAERLAGPFAPLEPDWKERVRNAAAK
jgi:hypothetical protein